MMPDRDVLVSENDVLRAQIADADSVRDATTTAHTTLFVFAIVLLSACGVAAIATVFIMRPDKDNTGIVAAILGFLVPTVSAFLAVAVQQVHKAVNSRLTQLLLLTAKASRAEGIVAAESSKRSRVTDFGGPSRH